MSEPSPLYSDDVGAMRQPMVTSIGIIMGFLLAFMANWAVTDGTERALQDPVDWVVAATILSSISLMVAALARLLNNRIRQDHGQYYQTTFRLYIGAIVIGLLGLTGALVV